MADLVKMVRKSDGHEADVHPDMVEDYKRGDYVVQEAPKKRGRTKKSAD
jgi:hypothetical protein